MGASTTSPPPHGRTSGSLKDVGVEAFSSSSPLSQPNEDVHLRRVLGVGNSVGMLIGCMVGAGIFVAPNGVVQYTGSVGMAMIIWAVSGMTAMIGAICFVELGTMIPKNGSSYAYIFEAFGDVPAFLMQWVGLLFLGPASNAINALVFASYLLQPLFPDCPSPPPSAVQLLAAVLVALLGFVNGAGVKLGSRVQTGLSGVKIASLLIIIVSGLYYVSMGNIQHFKNPMQGTIWEPTSLATAFYSTWFAYSGWDGLNFIAEEIKNPNRNMPLAITLALLSVTVIYLLTNAAYFAVLTPAEVLSSQAVAVTFGNRVLGVGSWIIAIFVAVSACGSLNGMLVCNSRQMFAAARAGHLPYFLSFIRVDNYTPVTAVLFTTVPILLMLAAGDVEVLLAYSAFTANLVSLTTALALLWLRYKQPHRHRPFKVWLGFPILFLAINIFVTVFPVVQKPIEIAVALGMVIIGYAVYLLFLHFKVRPKILSVSLEKLTYANQVILECLPEKGQ